ncbi:hypothetical protein CSUB01_09145 [Colletotrichum sublineola]|uniref:Protein kinase domain-containing protein n=1 Tax=Colletotrichum sublineola TaxID=1173701 RepID=A0A066XH02_COLSU|nr:hypothetical protein CSUB01_09145 [Colletotrichum sublineola]
MISGQPDFEQHFQTALSEFEELRKQQTRTSAHGQQFVLMKNVTARLQQRSESCPLEYQHDLDRLGQTAYLREYDQPPQMRTHHIQEHLAIFYNLLEIGAASLIHEFRNKKLTTLPIEMDTLKKHIKGPSSYSDFHGKFYQNQFVWCPIQFEMDMGPSRHSRNLISPFSRKDPIEPYRDGKGPRVNTATLYAIEVPEELVGPRLQKKMPSAKKDGTDSGANGGKRYRFALKQFKESKHEHFVNERQMFTNLENNDGMIQYIGWFKSYEPDDQGGLVLYWNIVLELADFDFYTAIRTESPPISAKEILGFWKAMAEISGALASIHTVDIGNREYLTWHGDIKPENILRVNGRFKLADPGEGRMRLKSIGTTGDQKTRATGGTRTYADPEKAAYLDCRSGKKPEVSQTSDVWSLGCVLSIAATYVVLGTQGVLIFNQLRREAIFGITENLSDAFHDGKTVLAEVRHWHDYLREAARRNDFYTSAVLDMVDNHMLVERCRWSAKRICQKFEELFDSHNSEASRAPRSLHELLQRIDLQSEQLFDYRHSVIRRVDSDDTAKQIQQVPSLPPADVEFKSREQLLEQPIQPVAQRSQDRAAPLIHSRNQSYTSQITSTQSRHPDSPTTRRKPITVWQVKDALERRGMAFKPSIRSFGSLISKQPLAVKGKNISDDLEQLDRRLEAEFKNRDIVGETQCPSFVTQLTRVDISRRQWDNHGSVLVTGDSPFRDTNPKAMIKESRSQKLKHFTKAMDIANPAVTKFQGEVVDTTIVPELTRIINGYTRAKTSKSTPRKKTIIILTDGIWKGMRMEHTIDVYLRSIFNELKDLHGDLSYIPPGKSQEQADISKIRPITIQFVQFGDDQNAIERLRRLDDDMRLYGCPDLIDTEHAYGDVYKVFLGSLCQDIDGHPSIERQPSSIYHRSSAHRQDFPQTPVDHGSVGVSRNTSQASHRASQVSPVRDQPSSSTIQHHELPASPEDPNSPHFLMSTQRSSTIKVTNTTSHTGPSSNNTSSIWPPSSHEDTQHEQSPVTPTSPISPSQSDRRQQAYR